MEEFYRVSLRLMLEDYRNGKLKFTLKDAEELYSVFGITTIIKNNKIKFGSDKQ